MSNKSKEDLEKDVKDLIKVNNKNVIEYQKVDKENIHLTRLLKQKEEEIFRLKDHDCSCRKYNKSMDEVVHYAQKNNEALKSLKNTVENQKIKISSLKEEKTSLSDRIEHLEFELETDHAIFSKLKEEIKGLEGKVKDIEKVVDKQQDEILEKDRKQEEVCRQFIAEKSELEVKLKDENTVLENHIELLNTELLESRQNRKIKQFDQKKEDMLENDDLMNEKVASLEDERFDLLKKCKDLEDEVLLKESKILELEKTIEEKKMLEVSSKSLADELNYVNINEDDQGKRIEKLETKITQLEESKAQRMELFNKMDQLSASRSKQIENLKQKISQIKSNVNPNCWYGQHCRRLFCKFNHRYLFVKTNEIKSQQEVRNPCTLCNEIFKNNEALKKHEERVHLKQITDECENCGEFFVNGKELQKHVMDDHINSRENCNSSLLINRTLRSHMRSDHGMVRLVDNDAISENEEITHDSWNSVSVNSNETSYLDSSESESGEASTNSTF